MVLLKGETNKKTKLQGGTEKKTSVLILGQTASYIIFDFAHFVPF